MKIIFLNIWGGKVFEPLTAFLREHAPSTDFFCLQEVFDAPRIVPTAYDYRTTILKDLNDMLPDFVPHFAPAVQGFDGDMMTTRDANLTLGIGIWAKKNIEIESHGDFLIVGENWRLEEPSGTFPHNLQYIRFRYTGVPYTLAHLHGAPQPGTKRDTDERIAQSQKVINFLAGEKDKKILGGDFNLLPDTESIRMIERAGMRNLITEYDITTTRNALSYGQYPESDRQYFADYAFVSPDVQMTSFVVPALEISDHLPLILELA